MDLLTIISIVCAIATVVGSLIAYLTYKRTPKRSAPPITPVSTLIVGVRVFSDLKDLPGHRCRW